MESSQECPVELPWSLNLGWLYVKVGGCVYDEWTPSAWCMRQVSELKRLTRLYRPAYGPNRSWTLCAWELKPSGQQTLPWP